MIFQIPHGKSNQFSSLLPWNITNQWCFKKTGWWFGTWILFSHILGSSSSQLTHIFQRGRVQPPTRKSQQILISSQVVLGDLCFGHWLSWPYTFGGTCRHHQLGGPALHAKRVTWRNDWLVVRGHVSLGIRWLVVWGFWATLLVGSVEHVFSFIYWEESSQLTFTHIFSEG